MSAHDHASCLPRPSPPGPARSVGRRETRSSPTGFAWRRHLGRWRRAIGPFFDPRSWRHVMPDGLCSTGRAWHEPFRNNAEVAVRQGSRPCDAIAAVRAGDGCCLGVFRRGVILDRSAGRLVGGVDGGDCDPDEPWRLAQGGDRILRGGHSTARFTPAQLPPSSRTTMKSRSWPCSRLRSRRLRCSRPVIRIFAPDRSRPSSSFPGVEASLDAHAATLAAARRERLTQDLPSDEVERIFALEHLHQDFIDLARCVSEFAQSSTVSVRKTEARPDQSRQ